ncbi:MAG TPA: cation:proton antiporter [Stellaceae bacterium]|jgi:CPA1 family monovalent cation:H+ antiporter|nr:cation:proton antiporter [Stellaceae bacterium]
MPDILLTVLGVAALLGLVSLLQPLAERLAIPYAVLLALAGIALGIAASAVPGSAHQFMPSSETLLAIFLPPLLFEAALNIDVRQLSDEIGPVLLLAVIGVVVCTFTAGYALAPISNLGLLPCIALGAIIATTDPVAVVGVFRAVGAPRRLATLVEGESLFNDAAAIAIYSVVLGMLSSHAGGGALDGVLRFLWQFIGGLVVGFVAGQLTMALTPLLRGSRVAEPTLTVGAAYITYVVCDHYIDVSGVVGVAAAAITISAGGRRRLTPSNWENLVESWEQLAFWASSLIFLLAAMQAPEQVAIIHGKWLEYFGLLAALVAAALVARAVTLYVLVPLLSLTGIAEPVDGKYKLVMLWGGMRGAVSLALALAAIENDLLPNQVGALATGFVLFTLLVNAPTLRPLMHLIRLGRLSPVEAAVRDRVLDSSRAAVQQEIEATAREYQIEADIAAEVAAVYRTSTPGESEVVALPDAQRTQAALMVLAEHEEEAYSDYFEGRTVSRQGAAVLLAYAGQLREKARSDGVVGYELAASRLVKFDRAFRIAHLLHRRFGIDGPLAQKLADRYELLLAARAVVHRLTRFNHEQIGPLFGDAARTALGRLLTARRAELERAISALKLQYPSYARQLETHFLGRAAARAEDERYMQLRAESIVNRDVFEDLERDLQHRRHLLDARPTLDLGLNREELLGRVPMFASLDDRARQQVAQLLRPRLAVPGEKIITRGQRGDQMYFVSSGAVEVHVPRHPVQLGTGDFFGEMAILGETRRNADVVALAFCQLLTLAAGDLDTLLNTDPAIEREIQRVFDARRAATAEAD